MADATDQGSLATDELEGAREERDAFVESERGLPDSASNHEPLPLETIDTMVNKAEGDHEALAENAYQAKIVEETDGVSFNGLTSVEEKALEEQRADIAESAPGSVTGEEANTPPESLGERTDGDAGPDATDAARELARERSIDLSTLTGSGENGRITKSDVEAASA